MPKLNYTTKLKQMNSGAWYLTIKCGYLNQKKSKLSADEYALLHNSIQERIFADLKTKFDFEPVLGRAMNYGWSKLHIPTKLILNFPYLINGGYDKLISDIPYNQVITCHSCTIYEKQYTIEWV